MNTPNDLRQYAPATQRNREFILEVLLQVLPPTDTILEVAVASTQHLTMLSTYQMPANNLSVVFQRL
ncbi:MAG: DUF938 domain-containing protein [Stigonema ocellatum SAG 48.90 = DSM 106950]|nr:DUF938 domain-containing protein [Stigonema ocellatum SAG 48.90 = DSM 106950]